MPKCVKCYGVFHPDMCIEQEIRGNEVIVCKFCRVDKNVLTIEDKDGNFIETITKEEARRNYLKYLDDLSKKPNIAKILSEGK